MKFSIEGFFGKCEQIRGKLRIWPQLLKKSLIEKFIFCAVNNRGFRKAALDCNSLISLSIPLESLIHVFWGVKKVFIALKWISDHTCHLNFEVNT